MRLSERSYPHPVLGNADDVPDVAFQATYEMASDRQFYFINITVVCSSDSLQKLLHEADVCYVLHVECSNTLFRRAFDFVESTRQFSILAEKLNGSVELNCFIRAKKDLPNYQISGSNVEYADTKFDVRTGDILAISEGCIFEAEPQDTLCRIGSIMLIEESQKHDEHPMEVEFNSDKIRIRLCKHDFDLYKKLKVVQGLASHLTTTIVLPVLTEALHIIGKDPQQFDDLKWCRNLRQRIANLDMTNEDDPLRKAQILLEGPIRRALASAAQYAQDR